MFLKKWNKYTTFTNDKNKFIVEFTYGNISKMNMLDYIFIRMFNRKDYFDFQKLIYSLRDLKDDILEILGTIIGLTFRLIFVILFPITMPLEAITVIRKAKKALKK